MGIVIACVMIHNFPRGTIVTDIFLSNLKNEVMVQDAGRTEGEDISPTTKK